ncbi:hypothetical protein H0H92_000006 [Tricholoma furcatifolium]|nr:hypothetical protein H0H92_000006 [Tricholoma furcatifolium]
MSDKEYEVESITQARVEKTKGKKKHLIWKYRVRWKGYGESDDTWEPIESFSGSEQMVEQFWERANVGGRDYRNMTLFKAGEEIILTGPPRRKSKPVKSTTVSDGPSSGPTVGVTDKRPRSPSVVEIMDSDDEKRPTKRSRADPISSATVSSPPTLEKKTRRGALLPVPKNPRISPKKHARAPSYDEIIPASDDEPGQLYDLSSLPLQSVDAGAVVNISKASSSPISDNMVSNNELFLLQDTTSIPPKGSGSHPTAPSLPAHRMKAANPKVKITEIDFGPVHQGTLSVKARVFKQSAPPPSATQSPSHRTSKPGPGRSSSGLMMKNTSSLLTFEKGELKTVKGRYRKETRDKSPVQETHDADLLWGGEDDMAGNESYNTPINTVPPSAGELLHLAGADLSTTLPDFEDDVPTVAPNVPNASSSAPDSQLVTHQPMAESGEQEPPSTTPEHQINRESFERAKNNLFPANVSTPSSIPASTWKHSTMFGPLTPNPPFFINLGSSASIPVTLTDTAPSHPGSPSLALIVAKKGPPGVFYNQKAALALLNTLRTGGPSAKVDLHMSATPEHQSHFEKFRSRLSDGELVEEGFQKSYVKTDDVS